MIVFKEIKDIDHDLILQESEKIINSVGWDNCQISLQYSDEVSWHKDIDRYGSSRVEHECLNFHPDLENTYLKHVLTSLDFPVASARLMFLHERSCYSTHVDLYTRYHIPVINDPFLSYMVFPDLPFVARMPKGKIYWTDTHQLHNFVNGDHTPRVHIIFNDANERENFDNRYLRILHGDKFT
jgi:hypothetical protein